MRYIECPEEYIKNKGDGPSLFLAGGITGCSNWQEEYAKMFKDNNIVLINPRRKFYPENDMNIVEQQITWEYRYLKNADATSFWFTSETLCPITLYELGKQLESDKPVFIGINPKYARKKDIEIQTRLIRPEIKIVYDLKSLSNQIKIWNKKI